MNIASTIPSGTNYILPDYSLEDFEELNYDELNCIFAESGADREPDYDRETEVEKLYFQGGYNQLKRYTRDFI